ncbi:MAG: hypothetical protein OQK09_11605 [Colwellia sp.]|nr:hypothetical protein [Colwellia sp.]MCW8864670.1 hypothetical protein [Colwellia sp.]MCW9082149.1 hypothetical protein [Colwellia sp.]
MTKVIETLAQLASDASLQSAQAMEKLLIDNNIEDTIATAVINKDVVSLERQLDVCPDVVCFLVPAEDDEQSEDNGSEESETNIKLIVNG